MNICFNTFDDEKKLINYFLIKKFKEQFGYKPSFESSLMPIDEQNHLLLVDLLHHEKFNETLGDKTIEELKDELYICYSETEQLRINNK